MNMRRFIYFFVVAVLLTTAGCNRVDIPKDEIPETVTLKATIEQGDTKAFVSDNYLYWHDGDNVWVNGKIYTLTVDGDNALIEGVAVANSYLAVYPATMAGEFNRSQPSVVTLNFSETQQFAIKDGSQVLNLPIVGYISGEDEEDAVISFVNAGSLLKICLNNDKGEQVLIRSITVTPESSSEDQVESFNGSVSFDRSKETAVAAASLTAGETLGVSLDFGANPIVMEEDDTYEAFIAVPTLASSKLSINVLAGTSTGKIYTYNNQTKSAKSLAANSIGAVPVALEGLAEDFSVYFPKGSGTEDDPYIMETVSQFYRLQEAVDASLPFNRSCFKLGNDIDFGGASITPIGTTDRPFFGSFDGGGFEIKNLAPGRRFYYKAAGDVFYSFYGLFGWTTYARFKNLTINADLKVTEETMFASILCAVSEGSTFTDVTTTGSITSTDKGLITSAAGIVAAVPTFSSRLEMAGCTNRAKIAVHTVNVMPMAGGLVGFTQCGAYLTGCANYGNISMDNPNEDAVLSACGGLIGRIDPIYRTDNYEFTVDRCRNYGSVYLEADEDCCSGGLVGLVMDADSGHMATDILMHVSNFVNAGSVTAKSTDNDDAWAGGVVGDMHSDGPEEPFDEAYYPYYYNCLNTGIVDADGNDSRSGGIAGYVFDTDTRFIMCVNTGEIKGENDPHRGAISGGSSSWFADGGRAYSCFWTDTTLPCLYDDAKGYAECEADPNLSAAKLNNRLNDGTLLNGSTTRWTAEQWAGTVTGTITACAWKGNYKDKNLDIDF